jgi:hypothetical protein
MMLMLIAFSPATETYAKYSDDYNSKFEPSWFQQQPVLYFNCKGVLQLYAGYLPNIKFIFNNDILVLLSLLLSL